MRKQREDKHDTRVQIENMRKVKMKVTMKEMKSPVFCCKSHDPRRFKYHSILKHQSFKML
jgi:hypothetical protein